MNEWSDAPQILLSFVSALSSFDWGVIRSLSSSLVKRLDGSQSPFPASIAKQLLSGLRRKRQFHAIEQLADALIRSGQASPEIYRYYAQSMIDQGSLTGASLILNSILNHPDSNSEDKAEANGLLGRIGKQLYVNAGNPSNPRQQANLTDSIQRYYQVYRTNPARFYWQGINTVALLNRGARDGTRVEIGAAATEIASELGAILSKDILDRWERATAIEHAIAIGNFAAAAEHAFLFVSDFEADAFEIASLQRQLIEVWQLDSKIEPGKTILPLVQAALLQRVGGAIEVGIEEASEAAKRSGDAQDHLERVFGQDRYEPLDWLKTALTRCSAVGRVESTAGRKIGTGFLVKACDFFPAREENELLFLTNSHVIGPSADLYDGAIPPNAARVKFEKSGETIGVGELVWSSPPGLLDTTFATLAGLDRSSEKCPLVPEPAPFDKDKRQRLYVIGYPLGGGLSFSLQDSMWLDSDSKVLHYRTPTEPGSSGSPVFDQDYWTVVGLHHRGIKDMPRLNGAPGTYDANEAISISAIQKATRANNQIL